MLCRASACLSTGSLATARSLDRPTELKFLDSQERWRWALQAISYYVLDQAKLSTNGGALREAMKSSQTVTVDVKFPSVRESDLEPRVAAIVNALTLGGYPVIGIDEKTGVGLLLSELGVEDVQTVLNAMYPNYDPERDMTPDPVVDPAVAPPSPAAQMQKHAQKEASLLLAVAQLREALEKIRAKEAA